MPHDRHEVFRPQQINTHAFLWKDSTICFRAKEESCRGLLNLKKYGSTARGMEESDRVRLSGGVLSDWKNLISMQEN